MGDPKGTFGSAHRIIVLSQNYSVFEVATINEFLSIIRKLSGKICTFKQDSARHTGHVKQSNQFACNFAKCVLILKILSWQAER